MAMSKEEQYIRIKNDYRKAHSNEPASGRVMLEWARDTGLFKLDLAKAMSKAVSDFTDALRGEMTTDRHGNQVRVNLPFRDPQIGVWSWDQRDTIGHKQAQLHVSHSWRMTYSDMKSTIRTINDYSDLHPDLPPLQYSLDWEGALADDGITLPSSIELERLIEQLPHVERATKKRPEPSRPSGHRAARDAQPPADLPPHPEE